MEIIALSGKAGSGKDFIYEHYLAPLGYGRFALADHFKIWAVGRKLATYEEVFVTKPPSIRKVLQQMGTEEGRNVYGENVWLDTTFAWIEHLSRTLKIKKWCITDVRFENEVEYVQQHGGRVFRILAPKRIEQNSLSAEARQHISETALDNYSATKFDGLIFNDPEYANTVYSQVSNLLGTGEIWDMSDQLSDLEEDDEKIEKFFNKMDAMFDKMDAFYNNIFFKLRKK